MASSEILGVNLKWWDGAQWRPNPDLPTAVIVAAAGGATATTTAITSIPASVQVSTNFHVVGTVKTVAGVAVTNGSVRLSYYTAPGTWTPYGSSASITAGAFDITIAEGASRTWKAVYTAGSGYVSSESIGKTVVSITPKQYVKTYACSGSASYQSGGAKETWFGTDCYQGYYSSGNGNQKSVLMFPYATIQDDLAGATINKIEVYLSFWWGLDAGGTAVIGYINNSSLPASSPGGSEDMTRVAWSTKTGGKWCTLSNTLGNYFRDNAAKGLLLGKGPNNSSEYYGHAAGYGSTGAPVLRITYTR